MCASLNLTVHTQWRNGEKNSAFHNFFHFYYWSCGPDLTLMWTSSMVHTLVVCKCFFSVARVLIIDSVTVLMWIQNSGPQDKRHLLRMQME